jgi:hypothetical protein
MERLVKTVDDLMQATIPGDFKIATKTFDLSEVERVWAMADATPRPVFQMN